MSNCFWVMHTETATDQASLFSSNMKIHMDVRLIRKPVCLGCIHSGMSCLQSINFASKTWNWNVAHVCLSCVYTCSVGCTLNHSLHRKFWLLCKGMHACVCHCVCVCGEREILNFISHTILGTISCPMAQSTWVHVNPVLYYPDFYV